ncbi:MAG: flagellar basal-body MS-ring/collar protein FliF [Gammaproteobacteria bacterium]
MALVKTETLSHSFKGMSRLDLFRQVGLAIGLAAAIAIGVAVALWSTKPGYTLLYGGLTDKDAAEIAAALQRSNIPFKVDGQTGGILVPAEKMQSARLLLAGEGLPSGTGIGYEILQKEQGLGTSRALEAARFQRALEVELSRSIGALTNVRSARVHLAIPRQSVFVRGRKKPRASVLVHLQPGRVLEKGQVEAIVHMVAASVPEMSTEEVKVIDHKGRLLTNGMGDRDLSLTAGQFEMTRQLEERYVRRIESILTPLLGLDGVRAEVAAELDFSVTERTQESFNPDLPAVRSEQTVEEENQGSAGAQGIPGALSNQPPGAANAPEVATGAEGTGAVPGVPASSSRRIVRNYELDKTISHTRLGGGVLKRLSVAVLVDDKRVINDEGVEVRQPRTPEEIERLTALVKEAVGFSERRGDSVSVINASFAPPEAVEPVPEAPLWEQPWFWSVAKQAGGVLLVLLIAFGVLRPTLRSLAEKGRAAPQQQLVTVSPTGELVPVGEGHAAGEGAQGAAAQPKLEAPKEDDYQTRMKAAQAIVKEDPKRVAQVVKAWVASDG